MHKDNNMGQFIFQTICLLSVFLSIYLSIYQENKLKGSRLSMLLSKKES